MSEEMNEEIVMVGGPDTAEEVSDAGALSESEERQLDAVITRVATAAGGIMAGILEGASLPSGVFRDLTFIACLHALIASAKPGDFSEIVKLAGTMAGNATSAKEAMQRMDESRLNGG